jgi:hypothetical protein
MTRTIAKFSSVVVALGAMLNAAPLAAAPVSYISSTGTNNNVCSAAQPCTALSAALNNLNLGGGQVSCVDFPALPDNSINITLALSVTIDCAGTFPTSFANSGAIVLSGSNDVIKIRNLTINGRLGGYPAVKVTGSGTLVLENCVLENLNGAALDIEPNGPFNLVVKNTRISDSAGAGVLLKPIAGGSVKATFDHVTNTGNSGGGIRADSTDGVVNLDVTDSEISNNGGNGINAVAGSSQSIVGIKNTVIARNGAAGVQVNGANAGVLIATTLLDQNAAGATSVVNGGNMFTYGNNDIVGSLGSGFTATAPQH